MCLGGFGGRKRRSKTAGVCLQIVYMSLFCVYVCVRTRERERESVKSKVISIRKCFMHELLLLRLEQLVEVLIL